MFILTMNKNYTSKGVLSKPSFYNTKSNPHCDSIYTNTQTIKYTWKEDL